MNPQTPTTRHRHQHFGELTSRSSVDGLSARSPLGGTPRSVQHVKGMNLALSSTGSPLKIYSTIGAHNQATGTQRQEGITATMQHGQAVPGGSGKDQTITPSTPLSSLLDAARMMNHDKEGSAGSVDQASATENGQSSSSARGPRRDTKKGGEGEMDSHRDGAAVGANRRKMGKGRVRRESTTNGSSTTTAGTTSGRRRAASAIEQPASPPALKRRRVITARALASMEMDQGEGSAVGGMRRVRSALDVLADQAAAAVTQDGKGKGKAREPDVPSEEDKEKGRTRTRTAGRGRGRPRIHPIQGQVRTKKQKEEQLKPKRATKTPRPPPRVRGAAASPALDNGGGGATNASISAEASADSWQTGTIVATPARTISPSGTSAERQQVASADLKDGMASVSVLDVLQQSQQEILHGNPSNGRPPEHPPSYSLEQMGEATDEAAALDLIQEFGFRPVTREVEEEGSSPVRPLKSSGSSGAALVSMDSASNHAEAEARLSPPRSHVGETTPSSPITLTRPLQPSPVIRDCSASPVVEVDDIEAQNISNLGPATPEKPQADSDDFDSRLGEAVGDKITLAPAGEGFQHTGTMDAEVLVPITEGDMRQLSAPFEDLSRGQADVEMGHEELLAFTKAQFVGQPEGEERGAGDLLIDDIPVLSEMKALDSSDRDDGDDGAAYSNAKTEKQAERLQQEEEAVDAGTDKPERININDLPTSSSNRSTSPPPPAILGINSSQSLDATGACAFDNADDSDADAEGEVDVDAEGEIDSEIESPTIISPSRLRSEPGIQILGHYTDIVFRDTRGRNQSETVAVASPPTLDTTLDIQDDHRARG